MGSALGPTILAAIIATGFVGVLGIVLLWLGFRGRQINDHPVCRKCRFDLVGLSTPTRCPECGADLSGRSAIRIGERRKRGRVLATGVLLLLVVVAAVGVVGVATAKGYDWNRVKPVWLLVREGEGPDDTSADAAHKELLRRQSAGKLSPAEASRIVRAALRAQADAARTWRVGWGDLVEGEVLAGRLNEQDQVAYAKHAVLVELRARARVHVRTPVPVVLLFHPRAGSNRIIAVEANRVSFSMGGELIRDGHTGTGFVPDCSNRFGMAPWVEAIQLSPDLFGSIPSFNLFGETNSGVTLSGFAMPGDYLVQTVWRFRAGVGKWDDAERKYVWDGAQATWDETLERNITVVQEGVEIVQTAAASSKSPVRAPSSSLIVEREPARYVHRPRPNDPDPDNPANVEVWDLHTQVLFPMSSTAFAFDVIFRKGDREWHAGSVHSERLTSFGIDGSSTQVQLEGFNEKTVDVILRPSPAAAEKSTGLTIISGDEILFENVPIRTVKRGAP